MRGTWRESSFTLPQKICPVRLWNGRLGPAFERLSFLRAFEIERYVKMTCRQVSLSIGAPLGNLEGIRLPGLFERKG